MAPLSIVAALEVPPATLAHRFVTEALACAQLFVSSADVHQQVIGTENTRQVELYGWAANVDSHKDGTGWVYIVPLNATTTVCAFSSDALDAELLTVTAQPGQVVRLHDCCVHWTEEPEGQATVAAFIGSFAEPDDDAAVKALTNGIAALTMGLYYGAPRVREGFRALLDDECLAANDAFDELAPMLLADARKQRRYIELCGKCSRPAVRPDDKWPFFSETSRCRVHLADDASERKPRLRAPAEA